MATRGERFAVCAATNPYVLVALVYIVARCLAFVGVEARAFRDTIDYNQVAAAPLLSAKFLAGDHPPTVPLVYKLLAGDDLRLAGQLAISIASWLALAAATASSLRHRRMRVVAFAAVLGFSLSHDILMWDALLLSESVALSLTAVLVGAWLLFVRRPAPGSAALVLVVTALWTLSRDPHAYVVLLVAGVLGASLLVRGHRRLRAVTLVGLLAISAASLVSASVGYKRWQYPLQQTMTLRIATDPEGLDYFRRAGMPVTRRFLDLSRQYRATQVDPFLHPTVIDDPLRRHELQPFQLWLMREGRRVYMAYLISHPAVVAEAFRDIDRILLDPELSSYDSPRPPASFGALPDLLYPPGGAVALVYLAVAALLAAGVAVRGGARRIWIVPAVAVVSSLFLAVLVWHAVPIELDRHGLFPALLLRLGTLLLALMLADGLLQRRSSARNTQP